LTSPPSTKADANGLPLYTVQVAAMFQDQGEVLAVKVAASRPNYPPAPIAVSHYGWSRVGSPTDRNGVFGESRSDHTKQALYPGLFTVPTN
jgi:hypothetical protein